MQSETGPLPETKSRRLRGSGSSERKRQQTARSGVKRVAPVPALRKNKDLVGASQQPEHGRGLQGAWAILWYLHRVQERHGGELSDYCGYAQYCTRRLRSLRVRLAYTCSFSRRSSQYAQARIDESIIRDYAGNDRRFIEIGVLEAERAWAQAMDAKEQLLAMVSRLDTAADTNRPIATELPSLVDTKQRRAQRLRRYYRRRLRRAALLAERLAYAAVAARSQLSSWTLTELVAYACSLWSLFYGERHRLGPGALHRIGTAAQLYRTLYDCMAGIEATLSAPLTQRIQQVYRQRAQELERTARACETRVDSGNVPHPHAWPDIALVQRLQAQLLSTRTKLENMPPELVHERYSISTLSAGETTTLLPMPTQTVDWCGHQVRVPHLTLAWLESGRPAQRTLTGDGTSGSASVATTGAIPTSTSKQQAVSLLELLAKAEHYEAKRTQKAVRLLESVQRHLESLVAERPTDDELRLVTAFWRYRKALLLLKRCYQRQQYDKALVWVQEISDLFGIDEQLLEATQVAAAFLQLAQKQHQMERCWSEWEASSSQLQGDAGAQQGLVQVYGLAVQLLGLVAELRARVAVTAPAPSRERRELLSAVALDDNALTETDTKARALKVRASVFYSLAEAGIAERLERTTIAEKPLSSRCYLEEHPIDLQTPDEIARMPPAFRAMVCKPFVLDLAFQRIKYPELPERRDARRGLLNRLFGR
jgi:hypothetical protein